MTKINVKSIVLGITQMNSDTPMLFKSTFSHDRHEGRKCERKNVKNG